MTMEPRYSPHGVEERWQQTWEEEGLYNADPDPSRPSFAIAHPPPNVTGELHLGPRAPALARRHDRAARSGCRASTSSSSPATTTRASRRRTRSRSTSRPRGRRGRTSAARRSRSASGNGCASTAARSWSSSAASAPRSTTGASGSRWTTAYVRAVMRFFVHLWEKGWIYRANRIVNWCPFHLTSLSDLEVAHVEVDDALTYVRYPLAGRRRPHHDRDGAAGDDPRRRRGRGASGRRPLQGRWSGAR